MDRTTAYSIPAPAITLHALAETVRLIATWMQSNNTIRQVFARGDDDDMQWLRTLSSNLEHFLSANAFSNCSRSPPANEFERLVFLVQSFYEYIAGLDMVYSRNGIDGIRRLEPYSISDLRDTFREVGELTHRWQLNEKQQLQPKPAVYEFVACAA